MAIFLALLAKIAPLYLIVFLGYLAGSKLNVRKESVATLLIYFIAPFVIFYGVVSATFDVSLILLPLFFFIVATTLSIVFYWIGRHFWKGAERNLLAFTAGSGNTGYFGLPVILALFGDQYLSVAVLSTLGLILFENSVGYYFVARGEAAPRDVFLKMAKLPTIYAFAAGVAFLLMHVPIGSGFVGMLGNFKGAYSILGMMMVGLGLAGVTRAAIDAKLLTAAFTAKFLLWPSIIVGSILLDMHVFHLLSPLAYPAMLILSVVPLASNTVAFATQLNAAPEKAAVTVLASTLFALAYIPLFMTFISPLVL